MRYMSIKIRNKSLDKLDILLEELGEDYSSYEEVSNIVDKYFMVIVDGLDWGVIERSYVNWNEALECYRDLKEDYADIKCSVHLLRIDVIEHVKRYSDVNLEDEFIREEEKEVVIYSKVLGEKTDYKKQLLKAQKILQEVISISEELSVITESCESDIFNIMHGIELVKFSKLSGQQRDDILYRIEQDRVKRRAAKIGIVEYLNINGAVKASLGQIDKAINILEERSIKRVNENNKQHFSNKYKVYYDAVGIDYDNDDMFRINKKDNTNVLPINNKHERLEKIHSDNIETSFSVADVIKIKNKDGVAM